MKKLFCFLALSSLVLTSCSSDDNSNPSGTVLLKKTIETDVDGSEIVSTATYNGTKLVKVISDGGYGIYFTYTGDLITRTDYKVGGQIFETQLYTYNASNELIEYVLTEPLDGYGWKEVHVHNTDGSVSVTAYSGDTNAQTLLEGHATIAFANGEVSQITSDYQGSHAYTYDTKNSPFKNVTGYSKISYVEGEAEGILHNMLTDTSSDGNSAMIYTYNANDYPTSVIENYDGEESTTEFFYQ